MAGVMMKNRCTEVQFQLQVPWLSLSPSDLMSTTILAEFVGFRSKFSGRRKSELFHELQELRWWCISASNLQEFRDYPIPIQVKN